MKAAYMTGINQIEFRDDPMPVPGQNEALVKIAYTGICGSDVHIYHGESPSAKFPVVAGHEFSGIIESIPEGANNPNGLKPGDKVCGWIVIPCGTCEACIGGHTNLCRNIRVYGSSWPGTFREYIAAPLHTLYKLPDDADLRLYALVEPMAVGTYAVRETPVQVGDTVLVIGGGPIGLCAAMSARRAGASKVVIAEVAESKLPRIHDLGFETINPAKEDAMAAVRAKTNGRGFNCVLEASASAGGYELFTQAGCFRAKGMNIGESRKALPFVPRNIMVNEMYVKCIRIHQQSVFEKTVEMFNAADDAFKKNLYKMISNDYDFEHIKDAFDFCSVDKTYCKVMVKIAD